jgi:hypothetical protein
LDPPVALSAIATSTALPEWANPFAKFSVGSSRAAATTAPAGATVLEVAKVAR